MAFVSRQGLPEIGNSRRQLDRQALDDGSFRVDRLCRVGRKSLEYSPAVHAPVLAQGLPSLRESVGSKSRIKSSSPVSQDKDKQKWIPAPDSGLALSEMQLEHFNELFSTLSMYKAVNPQLVCEYSIKELQADDNRATTASDAEELDGYFREALPLILETYGLLHSIAKDADGGVGINEATWRVPIDGLHMSLFSNHKHQFRGPMHIITGWASAGPVADGRNW